jgi:two-component system, OmpR family, response regulator
MSKSNGLKLDAQADVATFESRRVALTPRETKLLAMLVHDGGRVLTRDEIVDEIWQGRTASPRAVDVMVFRLRSRLKRLGHPGIMTVFRRGYRLAA